MPDEHKLIKARERKLKAESLLNDEMLSEAFADLEKGYIKAWASSHPGEPQARENYYHAIQILGDVRRHLLNVVHNGKIAEKELADLANKFRPRAA